MFGGALLICGRFPGSSFQRGVFRLQTACCLVRACRRGGGFGNAPSLPTSDRSWPSRLLLPSSLSAEGQSWTQTSPPLPPQTSTLSSEASGRSGSPVGGAGGGGGYQPSAAPGCRRSPRGAAEPSRSPPPGEGKGATRGWPPWLRLRDLPGPGRVGARTCGAPPSSGSGPGGGLGGPGEGGAAGRAVVTAALVAQAPPLGLRRRAWAPRRVSPATAWGVSAGAARSPGQAAVGPCAEVGRGGRSGGPPPPAPLLRATCWCRACAAPARSLARGAGRPLQIGFAPLPLRTGLSRPARLAAGCPEAPLRRRSGRGS